MRSWLMVAPLGCLLAIFAAACAETNPGIQIIGVASPDDDCVFDPMETQTLISGRFDVTPVAVLETQTSCVGQIRPQGVTYKMQLILINRMIDQTNTRYPLMNDVNAFQATEAEVEIRAFDGSPISVADGFPARFRVPASGFVPSSGQGIVAFDAIPSVYGEQMLPLVGQTILLAVRVRGRTAGGSEQITGEFQFPVLICQGCAYVPNCNVDMMGRSICVVSACLGGQESTSQFCY